MALSRTQRRKLAAKRVSDKNARLIKADAIVKANARVAIVRANLSQPKPSRYEDGRGLYRSTMASLTSQSHRGYVTSNLERRVFYSIDDKGTMR